MDLAQILRELSRHRLWLLLGVLLAVFAGVVTGYRPSVSPPGLEKRAIELGAAETEVVLDSAESSIIDTATPLDALIQRAPVYAQLMSSAPVTAEVARAANIPPGLLVSQSGGDGSPGAEERSSEILDEALSYRLLFQVQQDQPLISIFSQAPTAEEAIALADAAAGKFSDYITRQQIAGGVPERRRVEVRQLGAARGGLLNPGVNLAVAALVAVAAFVAFCLLVLFVSNVARSMREARVLGDLSPADGTVPFASWADRRRATAETTPGGGEGGADDEPVEAGTASGRGLIRR